MAQFVEVAGVGTVEFPDGMSREAMATALQQLPTPSATAVPTKQPAAPVPVTPAPVAAAPAEVDPTTGKPYPEARALPEKSFWEKLMGSSEEQTQAEKARASNEAMARRIAAERGVPVSQIYKEAGGQQPVFNPEGRETKPAVAQAASAAAKSLTRTKEVDLPLFGKTATPEIILSAANTALRSFRNGDIPVKDKSWLDEAITGSKLNPRLGDANVAAFDNIGQNLGYSLTTMVTSALAGAAGTATAGPIAGVTAGMGTSGAVAYRASKDEFLSRVKDKLNKESKEVFERPLNEVEWNKAKKEFDSAATKYAAWEAIPEAVSNAIMLKAFTAPLRAINSADKLFQTAVRAGVPQTAEQLGETVTALGQNAAELKAGLTNEELRVADAFKQQFATTLITTGVMHGGTKGMQYANKFYETYVEPKVRPGSALAKAIQADLEAYGAQPPAQGERYTEPSNIRQGVAVEPIPTERDKSRPKLGRLEAARNQAIEGEGTAPPLSALEAARAPGLEEEQPTGPLAKLEGAHKPGLEQEPPVEEEDPRVASAMQFYAAQGFAEDDARMLAVQDVETATGEKIAQPMGRVLQKDVAEEEQRTVAGRAERAELQMGEANVPTEVPTRVTESIPDQYGYEMPSRGERAPAGPKDAFARGLDNAKNLVGQSVGREERERTSLEANQKRIASQVSQAFNREAYPDLGVTLGADWTRKILAKNPTPDEYQEAAYARLEELGGQLPEYAQPAKETPRVAEAPKAVEAKKERPQAPAAAAGVETVDPLAKFEGLYGATRVGAIHGNISIEKRLLTYLEQKDAIEGWAGGDIDAFKKANAEIARLEALLPEAEKRDNADRNKHIQKQMLGSAKEELDTAVAQGDITSEQASKLVEAARQTGNAGDASTLIEDALDQNKTPQLVAPKKETKEPAPLETEPPVAVEKAPVEFAPLELEAGRREELEAEPPEVKAVTKSELALPKVPKTRAPGGGRKISEESKTPAERTEQTNAINQFNRDALTLISAAKKFQKPTGQYPTEQEYDYAEAARLRSLDILRKKVYALSLVRDPKAGYIAAKNYIRSLKPGEVARAKALHEGTAELTTLPPQPKATLTSTQLEKFRKGELETMKPRGRPKKVKAAEEKKAPTEHGFKTAIPSKPSVVVTEAQEAELKQLRKESLAPTKSTIDLSIQLAKEAGVPESELQDTAETISDIAEGELDFDDAKKITLSDLADLTRMAAQIAGENHTTSEDPIFERLTSLPAALAYIAQTGTPLDAGIADALLSGENRKLAAKVKLRVVHPSKVYANDPNAEFWKQELADAAALFVPFSDRTGGVVSLAHPDFGHQGINNLAVLHEGTHAVTSMKLLYVEDMIEAGRMDEVSPRLLDGYKSLSNLMDRALDKYTSELGADTDPRLLELEEYGAFTDIHEFLAYGMTDATMKAFLLSMPGTATKKSGFSVFVDALLKLLNIDPKFASGLKDFVLASGELMQGRTPSAKKMKAASQALLQSEPVVKAMKKAKTQESETKRVMENLKAAEAGSKKLGLIGDAIEVARDPAVAGDILKAAWDNMSIPALQGWLQSMPSDVIVSVGTDAGIGQSLKETYKNMREVGAFRRRMTDQVEAISKPWITLKTKERNKLADVMLASTDLQVDPSKNKSNPELNKLWNALTPEAQEVYVKARDFYSNAFKLLNALALQRIEQSGLKGDINDPTTPKGRVAQSIKDTYKAGMSISPYFPLMREGQYWVSFGKGDNFELQTFTSPGARTRFIRERLRENTAKGDSRTIEALMKSGQADIGNDIKELQEKASAASPMLKKLFDSIDNMKESDMSGDGKDSLKADVFQMHLMALPEGTFRKQFIHRKNTKGYGRDALQNFIVSGSRIAGQMARAKYGPKIESKISAAKASIKGMPNKDRLGMFIREMELRAKDVVNPPSDDSFFANAVRFANRYIFAYTTTSIKTAVNNTFSFATNSVPTMAKYYGLDSTLAEMGRFAGTAFKQVGVTKVKPNGDIEYTWPSLGSSALVRNDPQMQKAIQRMEELDIVKQNQTFEVFIAKKGASASKLGNAYESFIRFTGMPFQGTERIVREVTFLSAVRLGLRQGLAFEAAIDKAVEVTDEALFNYDPENMPRVMRRPTVRVLATLKRFSYFTAIYHLRNAAQMIKPLKGESRRGAAYALFGSMGMTGLVGAGIYQAFGVSTVVGLYGMLQGLWNMINGDEPDDEDGLLKDLNFQRWFNTVYLPDNYGDVEVAGVKLSDVLASGLLTATTGFDFTSGLSQSNLWFKDTPGASGSDNAFMSFVESIGFPILSVPANVVSGLKDINEGDTLKGWEKLNPTALTRNPAVAYRYSQEGVLTGLLDTVKYADEFTAMQLFMQGLGYKSAGLAETMNANFIIKREMAKVENVKQDLLKRYYKAEKRGDDALLDKVDDQIDKFNAMYPAKEMVITGRSIGEYIRSQEKALAKAERGLTIEKKFQEFDPLRDVGLEKLDKESR